MLRSITPAWWAHVLFRIRDTRLPINEFQVYVFLAGILIYNDSDIRTAAP